MSCPRAETLLGQLQAGTWPWVINESVQTTRQNENPDGLSRMKMSKGYKNLGKNFAVLFYYRKSRPAFKLPPTAVNHLESSKKTEIFC